MTDLEIMQHAKNYLDDLAKGIDPLTGQAVSETDIVNNVRISRCLSYVSDVLRQVIQNGGIQVRVSSESEKAPFSLPAEDLARYSFGEEPVSVSVIAQKLNELAKLETVQKLKTTSITKFLMQSGLLFDEESPDGSRSKRPTEAGRNRGIFTAQRIGRNGEYTGVLYSREAQQFILDNLDAISAVNALPLYENQGKPWDPAEEDCLRQAVQAGTGLRDISNQLKRNPAAVRARLKKMGLAESGGKT